MKTDKNTGSASDEEIIEKVLSGNVNAFEIIVKKYEKMIYNLTMTKTRNRETAQDISQKCFLRVYKMLGNYKTESAFSTWIYGICQNLISDFYKKNKTIQTVCLSVLNPSEEIIRADKTAQIREIIYSLPGDLKDIIVLRDLKNLSYAQIAEMLDLEIDTVKSHLNRARKKLKNYILDGRIP